MHTSTLPSYWEVPPTSRTLPYVQVAASTEEVEYFVSKVSGSYLSPSAKQHTVYCSYVFRATFPHTLPGIDILRRTNADIYATWDSWNIFYAKGSVLWDYIHLSVLQKIKKHAFFFCKHVGCACDIKWRRNWLGQGGFGPPTLVSLWRHTSNKSFNRSRLIIYREATDSCSQSVSECTS